MIKLKQRKEFTNMVFTLIEEHRLTELQQIIEANDQPLPETGVRMGYRLYIDQEMAFRTRFFLIKKLREITRIEPDETIITLLVRSMIQVQPLVLFKLVCDGLNIQSSVIKSLNREIQDWYKDMIDNNQFQQVTQLLTITNLSPDPVMIQDAYKNYLISGRLISYAGLSKQLEIPPTPETIRQVYSHFHQALAPNSPIPAADRENVMKWYKRIESMTGIADTTPLTE